MHAFVLISSMYSSEKVIYTILDHFRSSQRKIKKKNMDITAHINTSPNSSMYPTSRQP